MEYLSNFSPIVLCSNLFNKLFEIGEKLLTNPLSFFTVHKKGWKSNFLEQNTFFPKRSSLRSQVSEHQNIAFNPFQTCWDTLYVLIFLLYYWHRNLLGKPWSSYERQPTEEPSFEGQFPIVLLYCSLITLILIPILHIIKVHDPQNHWKKLSSKETLNFEFPLNFRMKKVGESWQGFSDP